jgi:3-deoxy-manno-octulosonate cytidylyltransferase (CMP-KDO synthetase)
MVVNLQGDAPLTPPWFLDALVEGLDRDSQAALATPILRCDGATLAAFKADRLAGRVGGTTAVCDSARRALYFSKEVVPFTSRDYALDEDTPGLSPCRRLCLQALGAPCLSRLDIGPAGTA